MRGKMYMLGVMHPGCGGRYVKAYVANTTSEEDEMVRCTRCIDIIPAWREWGVVVGKAKPYLPFGPFVEWKEMRVGP